MSWDTNKEKEAAAVLDYEYLTQTEESWQEGPYDGVKLALLIVNMPGVDIRGLAPDVYKQAIDVLARYSRPDLLWGKAPEYVLQQLYKEDYGEEGGEWEYWFKEGKRKHGRV